MRAKEESGVGREKKKEKERNFTDAALDEKR